MKTERATAPALVGQQTPIASWSFTLPTETSLRRYDTTSSAPVAVGAPVIPRGAGRSYGDAAYVTLVHDYHDGLPDAVAVGGQAHYRSLLTWVLDQDGWRLRDNYRAEVTDAIA